MNNSKVMRIELNYDYQEDFYHQVNMRIRDNQFNLVALNLSGQRDYLEEKATKLITKYGYIGALKKSRKLKK